MHSTSSKYGGLLACQNKPDTYLIVWKLKENDDYTFTKFKAPPGIG